MTVLEVIGIRRRNLLAAAFFAWTLFGCSEKDARNKFQLTDITGAEWGRDFHLTDHTGQPRSLADFRGKVVMLFFGYTNCPDMCPTTLAKMALVVKRLGQDGKRVQGLFATLDAARDTPAVLARYVPAFDPTFLGLYSDAQTIATTAKDFKVFYALQPPNKHGFYTVDHNSAIFVFDARGRLRLYASAESSVESIVHDIKELLGE